MLSSVPVNLDKLAKTDVDKEVIERGGGSAEKGTISTLMLNRRLPPVAVSQKKIEK
ncbi:MAG: hypothetical protein M0Z71_05895 [Nitrospiraceae bacterium]|nr:hypothetical protein [Nitrospiraceae bacterium]